MTLREGNACAHTHIYISFADPFQNAYKNWSWTRKKATNKESHPDLTHEALEPLSSAPKSQQQEAKF